MRPDSQPKDYISRAPLWNAAFFLALTAGALTFAGPARPGGHTDSDPLATLTVQQNACVTDAIRYVPTGDEPLVGHIEVSNLVCFGYSLKVEWEMLTEIGPFSLVYDQTPNSDCSPRCPDTLHVWALPPGYTAIPGSLTLPEESSDRIAVYKYLGN